MLFEDEEEEEEEDDEEDDEETFNTEADVLVVAVDINKFKAGVAAVVGLAAPVGGGGGGGEVARCGTAVVVVVGVGVSVMLAKPSTMRGGARGGALLLLLCLLPLLLLLPLLPGSLPNAHSLCDTAADNSVLEEGGERTEGAAGLAKWLSRRSMREEDAEEHKRVVLLFVRALRIPPLLLLPPPLPLLLLLPLFPLMALRLLLLPLLLRVGNRPVETGNAPTGCLTRGFLSTSLSFLRGTGGRAACKCDVSSIMLTLKYPPSSLLTLVLIIVVDVEVVMVKEVVGVGVLFVAAEEEEEDEEEE